MIKVCHCWAHGVSHKNGIGFFTWFYCPWEVLKRHHYHSVLIGRALVPQMQVVAGLNPSYDN